MAKKEKKKEKKKKTNWPEEKDDETKGFYPSGIAAGGAGEPASSQNYLKIIRQI